MTPLTPKSDLFQRDALLLEGRSVASDGKYPESGRRALRCFQNELHHFYHFESEVV